MGSIIRQKLKLQNQLSEYISHTLKYTETVKTFCDRDFHQWTSQRQSELGRVNCIKDRIDQITPKFKVRKKGVRRKKLEKELGEVLKDTLEGLEELQHFLDAMEKLAITSLFVFICEGFMPNRVSSMSVCSVISAARIVSPLLVHFKRDAGAFFLPSLSNVEVLVFQLDKYIHVTQQICEKMGKKSKCISGSGDVYEWINGNSSLKLILNLSEESVQKLSDHLLQLTRIRMDESFRLTFLFGLKAQDFILIFRESHDRMLGFLSDTEEAVVHLDKMKKGSNISTVAGSSVGIAGGVLSIVGLALAPITAGVSLALTLTGVGLGVTSGVTGLVTGITEMAVNDHHRKNAKKLFSSFMEDVQKILDCVEGVASSDGAVKGSDRVNKVFEDGKLAARAEAVGKGIDALVDGASAVKALRSEEVIAKAVNMGLQEAKAGRSIPKLAADLPDIGKLAKGTPLAMSQSARAGFIGLNALFTDLDIDSICRSGASLAKGSKNKEAQLFRSRSVLWCSEVEAWEKIYNHLCEGISKFSRNLEFLEQPLYV